MSKFFKGFGIGAAVVAVAGLAGASYLAAKKIKESDKRVDELIKSAFKRKKFTDIPSEENTCNCDENCHEDCQCECHSIIDEHDDDQLEIDFESVGDISLDEATQDDYLELVIEERDSLKAENDELKKRSKRKRNRK